VRDHRTEFRVSVMCRLLNVHRSGYYAWLRGSQAPRACEDARLVGLIKQHWLESGAVYGYRKIATDLREQGERCSRHRVARLMRREGLRAEIGYRRPRYYGGSAAASVAGNVLARQFEPAAANQSWVTDITYLRTGEGFLFLAVVIDLFSRQVVGWAMRSSLHTDLVLAALLAAVWRRKPKPGLLLHSDQGCQYTSDEWQTFLKSHDIVCSMSRRGNCHDNAVAESFFQLLKRERIRRRTYATHAAARADVFDYIEMFYNVKRRHGSNGGLSPKEFEQRHQTIGT
jgi:putative transposase